MKLLITILTLLLHLIGLSQDNIQKDFNNDITILVGKRYQHSLSSLKYGVEFRSLILANSHRKIGLKLNRTWRGYSMFNEVILTTDSINIIRSQSSNNFDINLSYGRDYDFLRYLTAGINLIAGYSQGTDKILDGGMRIQDNGSWRPCDMCAFDYHNKPYDPLAKWPSSQAVNPAQANYQEKIGTSHYLTYGLSINLGAKLSIKKKWEIGAQYAPQLIRYELLRQNTIYSGPGMIDENNSYHRFSTFYEILFRYKL